MVKKQTNITRKQFKEKKRLQSYTIHIVCKYTQNFRITNRYIVRKCQLSNTTYSTSLNSEVLLSRVDGPSSIQNTVLHKRPITQNA